MKGIIYGIGVGPGDPELMTVKSCRLIRECDIIVVPGQEPRESTAWNIAAAAVPELAQKPCIGVEMPMIRDREKMHAAHRTAVDRLEEILDTGSSIAYLTLGDVTIYCTFSYLQHLLEADGYEVRLVSGISSICAAAARLNLPLTEWNEELHVIPGVHTDREDLPATGTCVIMKSAGRMHQIKELLRESGRAVCAVENCGMENERIYRSVDEIPDDAGYFSLIIAREAESAGKEQKA